jgi:hypothetical protein
MNEIYFIRQERCPECAKQGRDVSADNLAIYSDGHTHCFSCGYHTFADGIKQFNAKPNPATTPLEIALPQDCDVEYPQVALDWVGQYDLNEFDLLTQSALWSNYRKRLIFPIYDGGGALIAYQGRYFGNDPKEPKWFGKGNLKDTFNFIGEGSPLVLVEDVISAIKVGKLTKAMPLYGSFISYNVWKRLKLMGFNDICVWLDPDKRKEAVKFSSNGLLFGLHTRTIFSDRDPKELNYLEIEEILK